MQIDPRVSYWLNVALGILMAAAGGMLSFSDFLDPVTAKKVASACAILAFVLNMVLHGYSAPAAGPGLPPLTPVAKAMILMVFLIGALSLIGSASAQTTPRKGAPEPPSTALPFPLPNLNNQGKPAVAQDPPLEQLWEKITSAALVDLKYAKALSDSVGTPGSEARGECWAALIKANEQAQGATLVDSTGAPMPKPDPHLFTDVEKLGQTIDNLAPNGPVFLGCSKAASMLKISVLAFINAAVGGAAGLAALGVT